MRPRHNRRRPGCRAEVPGYDHQARHSGLTLASPPRTAQAVCPAAYFDAASRDRVYSGLTVSHEALWKSC